MRLTKLKLAGFKSFVDPTTVLLPGQLVGVVGPNGCGKSNIMDAVRWVLGESKASELRGDSMQDVIFNGSGDRKPVGRASVELVFENSLGRAMGAWSQYAEIAVKRVLDRQGTSSYHINNTTVRRRDVIDLFLGTGLGPRAYAIIGQGMISRLIEARPEDLRLFLEEAAGVTKYRERRKETEGRLSDARENLERLADIRGELESQITRLDAQAEVAQRYRALADDLARRQALLWLVRRESARRELERLATEIGQCALKLDEDIARLRGLESDLEVCRSGHYAASDALQLAQSEFYAANGEVARLEGELAHRRDTRGRLEARLAQLDGEAADWRRRVAENAEELETWQDKAEEAAMRREELEARHELSALALPRAEQAQATAAAAVSALRREQSGLEQQLRVQETHRANSQRASDDLERRRARLIQEEAGLVPPDVSALEDFKFQQEELDRLAAEQRHALAEEQASLPRAQEALRHAQEAERTASRALMETKARRDALVALQDKVGRDPGLDAWKSRLGLVALAPLWKRLHVEPGWETALEAVLRERLAALAVQPEHLAAALAQPPSGTLALLCPLGSAGLVDDVDGPGVRLAECLRTEDEALADVLREWLKGVHCADDLSPWLGRRETLAAGLCLVDRKGQVLDRNGLTFHAPDARTHGVLERQEEIATLDARLGELGEAAAAGKTSVQAAEATLAACQERVVALRRQGQDSQQRLHQVELEVVRLSQVRQRFEERKARFELDREEIERSLALERERVLETEEAIAALHDRLAELLERADIAQEESSRTEDGVRSARLAEQQAARALQESLFEVREAGRRVEELERGRTLAAQQLGRLEAEAVERAAEAERMGDGNLVSDLQTALTLKAGRESALAEARNRAEVSAMELRRLEEERLRSEQGLQPLRERQAELRLGEQAARMQDEQAGERLAETGLGEDILADLLAQAGGQAKESTLNGAISRLSKEIAALGPVNLAALDEVVTARKRKGYLDEQSEDLNQAITTLEDAIRRMDRETREQLKDTYQKVNDQFGRLFPELFGGGEACLILTGDEILDAGVQVMARPPGKKNSTIHLLSGGEKALTAIALVFSFFQLNPAPFCLLDEVDAPLDDTNTERFCAMVRRMSEHTQFLFISHSRITMEMAQQLVGVTMQESGVSRVVEVDMEEALKMREAA